MGTGSDLRSSLQTIIDQLFAGAWLVIDDNIRALSFGDDWDAAVRTAKDLAEQHGWAFVPDKSKREFRFGRAYTLQTA